MANINVRYIIMAVVALIVIAVLFPIGLGLIGNAGNTLVAIGNSTGGTDLVPLNELVDPTVLILLTVLVPILAVIGIVMFFLPSSSN